MDNQTQHAFLDDERIGQAKEECPREYWVWGWGFEAEFRDTPSTLCNLKSTCQSGFDGGWGGPWVTTGLP